MTDYFEPRFTLSRAATATGFSLNTLRSNFQRGWFRSFAAGLGIGQGRTQRLCLSDVLVLTIARKLIAIGVHPVRGFNAALTFGLAAKAPKQFPRRMPCELFDPDLFETVFIWQPGAVARVIPVAKGGAIKLGDLGLTESEASASVCLSLNAIEADVFDKLALAPKAQLRA